jgi:putative endonuclease
MTAWSVYLIRAAGGVIYTGIATDVERRLGEHRAGRGAKYLRGRGPLRVVYRRELGSRSLAQSIEHRLKALTKAEKRAIVRAAPSRKKLLRTLEPVVRD